MASSLAFCQGQNFGCLSKLRKVSSGTSVFGKVENQRCREDVRGIKANLSPSIWLRMMATQPYHLSKSTGRIPNTLPATGTWCSSLQSYVFKKIIFRITLIASSHYQIQLFGHGNSYMTAEYFIYCWKRKQPRIKKEGIYQQSVK